jgi:hypothetical protein
MTTNLRSEVHVMIDTKSDPGSYADHMASTGRFRAVPDSRDAEIAALREKVKELRQALMLLLHEVDESGNGYSTDFGWPKATRAAREALRGEGE